MSAPDTNTAPKRNVEFSDFAIEQRWRNKNRIPDAGEGGGAKGPLTLIALAVGTYLVAIEFQQILDCLLILGSLGGSRTSRHEHGRCEERNAEGRRVGGEEDEVETEKRMKEKEKCGVRWPRRPEARFMPDPVTRTCQSRTSSL